MTTPPLHTEYLTGRDEDGIAVVTVIPVTVLGDVRRTIGTAGDDLTVLVSVQDWPADGVDKSKKFDLTFGDSDTPIVLGG